MWTEFLEAVKRGDRQEVERLLDADPHVIAARDENGVSAVRLAHYHGRPAVAEALLARDPTLDVFEAATVGDVRRAQELLERDPSLANTYAADGFTPLGLAAYFGRRDMVELLLARGADPNLASRNADRFTPLHSAVAGADPKIARTLLGAGAEPNARQSRGATPLHSAAAVGDLATVRELLAHGGDALVASDDGKTPLDLARERGHAKVVDLLEATA